MPYILHPKHADTTYAEYHGRARIEYRAAHVAWMEDTTNTLSRPGIIPTYNDYLFALYPDYDLRKFAHAAMVDLGLESTHKITFIPTPEEHATWTEREHGRFADGTYVHVPWTNYDRYPEHFAHLSISKPGLVAFSRDAEHGIADRQTIMKPGKYLEEFYRGEFSSGQIATWIGECGAKYLALTITQDAKEIKTVYKNGPSSCMSHAFNFLPCHPSEVYAGPDLALAYYGPPDKASARAIVWPDKQIYSRVYGNESVLHALLTNAGYERGSLAGARVRKIPCDQGYVMPYVDYIERCTIKSGWIVLDDRGDQSCQNTDGYTCDRHSDDDANDEPEMVACDHCGRHYDPEDEDAGESFCPRCMEDRYSCDHCGTGMWGNDVIRIADEYHCEDCAHEHHDRTCRHPECEETWLEESFTDERQGERQIAGVADFCESCVEQGECYICHACDRVVSVLDRLELCPHCHVAPRCTQTADLLALNSDRIMEHIAADDAQTVEIRFYFHHHRLACKTSYGTLRYGCCLPIGHTGRHMCPGELEHAHHIRLASYEDYQGYVIPVPVSLLETY